MQKSFIHLLSYLLFWGIINACTRSVENNLSLVGKWQWTYSYGGIATQRINSSPNIVVFNFNSDSTYNYMENGVVKSNDKYQLTRINANTVVLRLQNFVASKLWLSPNGEIYTISGDTLTFTDYMISDGYNHYFQRIK